MASMVTFSKILMLSFLSLLINIIRFITLTTAQPDYLHYYCIDKNGNYTANSTYHTNLNTLLSNLSSNTEIDYGFYNFSYGQNPDKVNGIGMCRGDVKPQDCHSCLNNSRDLLTQVCPNQKEAIVWYDNCMLRYSSHLIFGTEDYNPIWYRYNLRNATDMNDFNQVVADLLGRLRSIAASGDLHLKFAEGNATGPAFQTIFAHAQCTPDLSQQDCDDCLSKVISFIPNCCSGKIRARLLSPSCNARYDILPYYNDLTSNVVTPLTPQPSPSPSPSTTQHTISTTFKGKSNSSRIVIAIVVPIVSFVVLLTCICIYIRWRKPRKYFESGSESDYEIEPTDTETLQFDLQTIMDATNNFSDANKLGQGGFGLVYKGRLQNGKEVAIKRLSRGSSQGDIEFKNELLLVAKLQHRNLVRLLGFCLETEERILVYELLPKKSLDCFLFDPVKRLYLDWEIRYNIIVGIARGLLYLHEDSRLRIIHRDLKLSNILLDEVMNPKIADFGMARLLVEDHSMGNTNRVVGTYGYMAPEYAVHGHFSIKSDVFSFGVLVLEIVSGRKNSDIRNDDYVEHLISFAWRKWREGGASDIVDPTLDGKSRNQIMRCIHIGLLCVQEDVADRPTMAAVEMMLSSNSLSLSIPSQPAYCMNVEDLSNTRLNESRNNTQQLSANEASITDLGPR